MQTLGITRNAYQLSLLSLAIIFVLTGCVPIRSESPAVEAESEVMESNVYVDSVVIENRDGQYYAVVSGNFADACTEIADVTTKVDGDSLLVTTSATRPTDAMCAQVLTPFEEAIPLDVGELEAGDYSVEVNGVETHLTIGHEAAAADAESALTESTVYVDEVTVENRDGDYFAVVSGSFADSCSVVSDVTTEVAENTVTVSVEAARPSDAICAQVLTPFEEEIELDVEGVEPGEYTIEVNEATTTFTVSP